MNDSQKLVATLAASLMATGETLSCRQLAADLNSEGMLTTYGTPYEGGRGTYKLLATTYAACERRGDHHAARAVAMAFVNARGRHAWE